MGDNNDEELTFRVYVFFDGNLMINANGSDFAIFSLSAVNIAVDEEGDGVLTLFDVEGDKEYTIAQEAENETFGTFLVETSCVSDAPTSEPTVDPTNSPSTVPTIWTRHLIPR